MKKVLSLVLVLTMAASMMFVTGCGKKSDSKGFKVGCIMVGDEKETYTKAHMDGIKEAAKELGIPETDIKWKTTVPEDEQCAKAAKELIGNGCTLIIANSYGHQDQINKVAKENPKVDFVSMTGDYAAISGNDNFYNAVTNIYEARYVSGVVAGMKIKELADAKKIPKADFDKDGNVKVGYIGAYPYAEVVSGYSSFFLGIKSVYEKVSMEVFYTNSWFDPTKEAAAAEKFIKDNCLIIGQHADSTGAPSAIQKAKDGGALVYSVGYNVSMLNVAKTAALTSPLNNWKVYYKDLLSAAKDGKEIPQDWAEGYAKGAVSISELGPEVAKGTKEKVAEVEKGLKDGSIKVFDTDTFTVDGKKKSSEKIDLSYMDFTKNPPAVVFKGETKEAIESKDGKTYFAESTLRSAPYFQLRIDGIKELNAEQ